MIEAVLIIVKIGCSASIIEKSFQFLRNKNGNYRKKFPDWKVRLRY